MAWISVYLLAGGLAVAIFVLWLYFARVGASRVTEVGGGRPELSAIQAGLLGLLGLLLGFTYSFAVNRFEERRQAVIDEANAIGTSYNLVGFISEPEQSELRSLLRDYARSRIVTDSMRLSDPEFQELIDKSQALHTPIWQAAMKGMGEGPRPVDALLSAQLNKMFDLHTSRLAAARERLPREIVWMLFFAAAASMAVSGFISGLHRRSDYLSAAILSLLIAAVIFVILDLDTPGSGVIRVSQQPLIDIVETITAPATQP